MSAPVGKAQREEIVSAVTAIIADTTGDLGGSSQIHHSLRTALAATGFNLLGVPEHLGGGGGTLGDLAVVVDLLAYHATLLPVPEEAFVAGWLITSSGLRLPAGVTVAALDTARGELVDGALLVTGTVRVPWGRHADTIAVLVRCEDDSSYVALISRTPGAVWNAENLAREPRDSIVLRDCAVTESGHARVGIEADALFRRYALLRAVQLAGAARAVLDQTLRYVREREQFGRPLAKFQVVQHHVATLASEVGAMQIAAAAALLATEAAEFDPDCCPEAELAVAAAKATTSAAAQTVAAIGHQLHGALGYSAEHPLGAATARLWAWRDECGNEAWWQDRIGVAVLKVDDWWSSITGAAFDCGRVADNQAGDSV